MWSYNGILLIADGYEDRVKLIFHSGAMLKDPKGVFNAGLDEDEWRAIELFEGDDVTRRRSRGWCEKRCLTTRNVGWSWPKVANMMGNRCCCRVAIRRFRNRMAMGRSELTSRQYPVWKRETTRRIDEIIVENVPGVLKAVRWNSPFYGIEGRGWFVSYHMFSRYIKVTFLNGAFLEPEPPGSGKDPDSRWIDIFRRRARRGAAG